MDPHKNRIGNCESCLKMRFLVQIPEKCENANSNAKSFKNAKKNASISGKGLVVTSTVVAGFEGNLVVERRSSFKVACRVRSGHFP